MAEISQKDQSVLHEFSVRYRVAYAEYTPSDLHFETIQDAICGEYDTEQDAKRGMTIEPPADEKEREPEEPDRIVERTFRASLSGVVSKAIYL